MELIFQTMASDAFDFKDLDSQWSPSNGSRLNKILRASFHHNPYILSSSSSSRQKYPDYIFDNPKKHHVVEGVERRSRSRMFGGRLSLGWHCFSCGTSWCVWVQKYPSNHYHHHWHCFDDLFDQRGKYHNNHNKKCKEQHSEEWTENKTSKTTKSRH